MAAIIFVDIVSYSKKTNKEQQALSQDINERCARFLVPEFREQRLSEHRGRDLIVAAMPTGDGMVVCLEKTPRPNLDTGHVLLLLSFYLTEWARHSGVTLRIGLHSGELTVIEDINGNSNFCGHAINQAQRIMDIGGPDGHILCSMDFHQSYLSSPSILEKLASEVKDYNARRGLSALIPTVQKGLDRVPRINADADYKVNVSSIDGIYTVKHDYQLKICNIVLSVTVAIPDPDGQPVRKTLVIGGLEEEPSLKVVHEIRDPKQMEETLGQLLSDKSYVPCQRIVIIGAINERFSRHFAVARSGFQLPAVSKVEVYFCSETNLESMRKLQDIDLAQTKTSDIPDKLRNRDMVKLRKESMTNLQTIASSNAGIEFSYFEYPFLPCAGVIAGYKDLDSLDPEIIQVNRYVWGQKSLWSSVQVLRRARQDNDYYEYLKFKRYIDFTRFNSERIPHSAISEPMSFAEV
ncbi:hypothetical protein [Planctomyces sp. SH-PL14]|uniref:hypothetical protein n=1 Tax=Planctomyces sp. SH-PL14 TaxID=1632864 RepID=UPI00078EBACC|nr:hypothetical protein [Planctomyces sp. SH-PL14]AMV19086.1 hypothetical protein VT03_14440 [Planctomyces sp. SH-PL14]